MKLRLLLSAILTGFVLQPASAETRKVPASPVVPRKIAKSPAPAAAPAIKRSTPSTKTAPVSAPGVRPAGSKKTLSLKTLFSRKPAVAPTPDVPPKAIAVAVKKLPPAKAKAISAPPVPVIHRNTGEFINISFPEPRSRKPSVAATETTGR